MSKVTAIKEKTKTDNEEEVLTLRDVQDKVSEIEAIIIFLANSIDCLMEEGEDHIAYGKKNNFGIHLVIHDLIDKIQSLLEEIEKLDKKSL